MLTIKAMLKSVHISGYRSLRDFRLKPARLTLVSGENGAGKSNLYRALALLQRLAAGQFAEAVAQEGGMPSLLWSGRRREKEPRRVGWVVEHDLFRYEMECGLVPTEPGQETVFRTDPEVKREEVALRARGRDHVVARRRGPVVELRGRESGWETSPLPLHTPESLLSEVRDANLHPGPAAVRETLLAWRFYHHFRTDAASPLRQARLGAWSPVLAHDGGNLAATLQTLAESGRRHLLNEAVEAAFPGLGWRAVDDQGRFQVQVHRPELGRWLEAHELSDGTLRYFCLCAALLTPKTPPFLVLNEPETSLHGQLLPAVARLISLVPEETQLLVVTHSRALAEGVADLAPCRRLELASFQGETRRTQDTGANFVWTADDAEEEEES